MKIVFIYDAVYPWIKGGAEKRVYEIAKRLAKNHEVHWYGIGWWWTENSPQDIELEGIHLHAVCKPIDLYDNGKRSIKEAIYFSLKLFPELMKENFDIIDCQSFPYFASFVAKLHSSLRRSVLILTWIEVWDDYWYEYLGKIGFFGKLVEKMSSHLTSNLIAISKKTKEDLIKIRWKKGIEIIPAGIDLRKIEKINPSEERSDVIFAGRLIENKNVDFLIKAVDLVVKKFPDLRCTIIGDGPERENLEKLTSNLGIKNNIKFLGSSEDHDELISHLKSSKVFVLPSTREGFGIVVIEANACGLPVVIIDHEMNAARDLINNNINGFISKLSKKDIAEKIVKGLEMKGMMQEKCVENAKKYDWNFIVNLLEKFYKELIYT